MVDSTKTQNKELLANLLRWYKIHERDLAWRNTQDPYEIWVSEVILQQTQVSRGIEYYERFLARFPDVSSLSKARWPSLLKVWRGLGYYRRAENMLKAAKIVVEEHRGEFPVSEKELRALPGVGPYTAAAIRSFAFKKCEPAIDTNLNRIIQRVYGCPSDQVKVRTESLFQLKPRSSRKLNYALMDLGSATCRARSPKCEECPFQETCHYYANPPADNKQPVVKQGKSSSLPRVDVAIACIHKDQHYLLGKRKRSKGGFWEFPGGKKEKGESVRAALKREVKEELGVEVAVRPAFLKTEFEDKQFQWNLHFCRCQILSGKEKLMEHERLEWVHRSKLRDIAMPTANIEAVERLEKMK